jgi:multidrug transporter EmrE-like cation transporter
MNYVYVLATIVLTVFGQLVIKWQVSKAGGLPVATGARFVFLLRLLVNPWIAGALVAALVAALSWMAAMTRLELSFAYPFMSLSFVLVLVLSALMLGEPLTLYKVVGMALVVIGLIVSSRSPH